MKKKKKSKEKKIKLGFNTYLKVGFRSLKEYWKLDKLNLAGQVSLHTLMTVGSIFSVYVASRVLGEVIGSVQNGGATASLYPLIGLQVLVYITTTFANSVNSLFVDLLFIRNEEYFTLKINDARANLDTEFYEDRDNQKLLAKVAEKGVWSMFEMYMQLIYLVS